MEVQPRSRLSKTSKAHLRLGGQQTRVGPAEGTCKRAGLMWLVFILHQNAWAVLADTLRKYTASQHVSFYPPVTLMVQTRCPVFSGTRFGTGMSEAVHGKQFETVITRTTILQRLEKLPRPSREFRGSKT
jgi:hypothetical protein